MSRSKLSIVWKDEEKDVAGFRLRPITMEHYEEWQACKGALLVRQTTLPVKYTFMPYLAALRAVDHDNETNFIAYTIKAVSLATGLPYEKFELYVDKDDRSKLDCILFHDGDTAMRIDPANFHGLRKAILEQNGESLPDEGDNPELLEAEADIAAASGCAKRIDYDMNTLVASVAYQCGLRKHELMDWSIREFLETKSAIDRDKNHLICCIAEKIPMFKWTKGNPCPSWCLDTVKEGSSALESMQSFISRTGISAM